MAPLSPSVLEVSPGPATDARSPQSPQVLRAPAAELQRGDQVAFVSPDGDRSADVAGEVTAIRRDPWGAVFVVVENRVHVLPADHGVVIVRAPAIHPG